MGQTIRTQLRRNANTNEKTIPHRRPLLALLLPQTLSISLQCLHRPHALLLEIPVDERFESPQRPRIAQIDIPVQHRLETCRRIALFRDLHGNLHIQHHAQHVRLHAHGLLEGDFPGLSGSRGFKFHDLAFASSSGTGLVVRGAQLDRIVRYLCRAFEGVGFGEPVVVGWEVDEDPEDLLGRRVDCDGGVDGHVCLILFLFW